jgi:hypothetical protein
MTGFAKRGIRGGSVFLLIREKIMTEIKKPAKPDEKSERPAKHGHKNAHRNTSGTPSSTGGSRQGNIGHESNDTNDNAHR